MSIYKTQQTARDNNDIEAYAATLHDDYEFISHMDGMIMNKEKAMEMFSFLMTSDDFVTHDQRCLYENDEAMVTHAVMGFPDGTREAVLAFHKIQDGKIKIDPFVLVFTSLVSIFKNEIMYAPEGFITNLTLIQKINNNDENEEFLTAKSTVLYNEGWHKGVIGIVASRVIETHYKPTIILTESNGKASGSARSVQGFDVYNAIDECSDLLEQFGGHMYAAGMTMPIENIDKYDELEHIRAKLETLKAKYNYLVNELSIIQSSETYQMILNIDDVFMKNQIDNTHCHVDGHVHAHHDGGKSHNHFEQEGLEQRQMHQYY